MWYFYQILCIFTLIVIAHLGDYFLVILTNPIFKALADNLTHAFIGFLAWLLVTLNIKYTNGFDVLAEPLLCFLIASLIDLDHFFAAWSIHLKDTTSLDRRPFLHLSTIPLSVTVILLGWAHATNNSSLEKVTLIMFVAFGTHHTRDAYRRGYWFAPFGSTPPLTYHYYIFISVLLPYLVVLWWKCCRLSRRAGGSSSSYGNDMEYLFDV